MRTMSVWDVVGFMEEIRDELQEAQGVDTRKAKMKR